jgi:hypothetical protein
MLAIVFFIPMGALQAHAKLESNTVNADGEAPSRCATEDLRGW